MGLREQFLKMIGKYKEDTKIPIDYKELGRRLAENRSKRIRGKGKVYWMSQAEVAVEYLKEIGRLK